MRIRRPQSGPSDHLETPAQPGGSAARPDIEAGQAGSSSGSAPSHTLKPHPSLTAMARLIGRQFAREATRKGGSDA